MNAGTIIPFQPVGKLLPLIPASDLASLIAAGLELGHNKPEILERIDSNRDALALRKKKERCENQAWLMSRGAAFPGFEVDGDDDWAEQLELAPLLKSYSVLGFAFYGHWWSSYYPMKPGRLTKTIA